MSTSAAPETAPIPNPGADTAWISWLRVVAICGVVTIHTAGLNAADPHAREQLRGKIALLLDLGSTYTVPVFVMVSGAMMLDPTRFNGPGQFLRKRTARLLPPIIFWHLWYYALIVVVIGKDLSVHDAIADTINGRLYIALYFFWIVLGLSVVAPLLIPFVRDYGPRAALIAGTVACALPVVMLATAKLRGTGQIPETAFTWWIPYLGFFLLGYGLRGVVLRGWALWLTTLGAAGIAVLDAWQWRNPAAPQWLQDLSPISYYSATGVAFAVLVYLMFHGHVAPRGALRVLTGPRGVRLGRLLGDATLGVFALHLTVRYVVLRQGIGGADTASPTTHDMLFRLAVVLVATWVIVLLLRRIPYVRALL